MDVKYFFVQLCSNITQILDGTPYDHHRKVKARVFFFFFFCTDRNWRLLFLYERFIDGCSPLKYQSNCLGQNIIGVHIFCAKIPITQQSFHASLPYFVICFFLWYGNIVVRSMILQNECYDIFGECLSKQVDKAQ